MFRTIVVGTDGSGTAATAVAHAAEVAKKTGAALIVVSAYSPPREAAPPFAEPSAYSGIEVAKGLLEDVERRYADAVSLRTVAREGAAADAIIETAEEEKADLIVVGNKGMTGAKRVVLGSVPNTISHHAPCHVLIVHTVDGRTPAAYSKIVVGTDGSATATKAVRFAGGLAKQMSAPLLIVHVGDASRGNEILAQAGAEAGGDTQTINVEGEAAEQIIEVAEREGADLIIVGNKGMTGAKRFLLGSVPNQVSHNAPCDLLICKTT